MSQASVYPNGCLLDVRASARGHDAAPDVFENIEFTAQLGAGTTAVTHDKRSPGGKPALVVMQYGLQGDFTMASEEDRNADCTLRPWLCSLPRPNQAPCPSSGPALAPARPAARWMGGRSSRRPHRCSPTDADPQRYVSGRSTTSASLDSLRLHSRSGTGS